MADQTITLPLSLQQPNVKKGTENKGTTIAPLPKFNIPQTNIPVSVGQGGNFISIPTNLLQPNVRKGTEQSGTTQRTMGDTSGLKLFPNVSQAPAGQNIMNVSPNPSDFEISSTALRTTSAESPNPYLKAYNQYIQPYTKSYGSEIGSLLTRSTNQPRNFAEPSAQTQLQEAQAKTLIDSTNRQLTAEHQINLKIDELAVKEEAIKNDVTDKYITGKNFNTQSDADAAVKAANDELQNRLQPLQTELNQFQTDVITKAQSDSQVAAKQIQAETQQKYNPFSTKVSSFIKGIVPAGKELAVSQKEYDVAVKKITTDLYNQGLRGQALQNAVNYRLASTSLKTRVGTQQFISGVAETVREKPVQLATTGLVSAGIGAGIGFALGGPAGAATGAGQALGAFSKIGIPVFVGTEALRIGTASGGMLGRAREAGRATTEIAPVLIGGLIGQNIGQSLRQQYLTSANTDIVQVKTPQGRNQYINQVTKDLTTENKAALSLDKASDLRVYRQVITDPVTGKETTYIYVETGKLSGPLNLQTGEAATKYGDRLILGAQLDNKGNVIQRSISTVLEKADQKATDLIARTYVESLSGKNQVTGSMFPSSERIENTGSITGIPMNEQIPARISFMGKSVKTTATGTGNVLFDVGKPMTGPTSTVFSGTTEQGEGVFADVLRSGKAVANNIILPNGQPLKIVELFPEGATFEQPGVLTVTSKSLPEVKSMRLIKPESLNINLKTIEARPSETVTYDFLNGGNAEVTTNPFFGSQRIDIRSQEVGQIFTPKEISSFSSIANKLDIGGKLTTFQKNVLTKLGNLNFLGTNNEPAKVAQSLRDIAAASTGTNTAFGNVVNINELPTMVGGGGQGVSLFTGGLGGVNENIGALQVSRSIALPTLIPPAPAIGLIGAIGKSSLLATAPSFSTLAPITLATTSPLLINVPTQKDLTAGLLGINVKTINSERIKPFEVQVQTQPQAQSQPIRLGQATPQVTLEEPLQLITQPEQQLSKTLQRTTPTYLNLPKLPPTGGGIFFFKRREKKPKKAKMPLVSGGYEVQVRRRGKFAPISSFAYPAAEAIARGAKRTIATAAATFRILPSKKPLISTGLTISPETLSLFRPPKSGEKGVFVQRATKRIISPGEVSEISLVGARARRSRASPLGVVPISIKSRSTNIFNMKGGKRR